MSLNEMALLFLLILEAMFFSLQRGAQLLCGAGECGEVGGTPTSQVRANSREINQNRDSDAPPDISNTCFHGWPGMSS